MNKSYEEQINALGEWHGPAVMVPHDRAALIAREADAEITRLKDDVKAAENLCTQWESSYEAVVNANMKALADAGLSKVPDRGSLKTDEALDAPTILVAEITRLKAALEEAAQFQGDVKVWMHFVARDVGTDRAQAMMKSFPRIAAQSEALQKTLTNLGIKYDSAKGEKARKAALETP